MQIAEIVPVSCLKYIEDKNYHMCLAQLVLRNKEYAEFYKRKAREGKYVILDNGAAEKESLSFDDLYKAYTIIQPTEIILPDVLKDKQETMKRSVDFYHKIFVRENCKIMIVPQAEDLSDWMHSTDVMLSEIPANTVGIPKWLGSNDPLNRIAAASYLAGLDVEIHLLGCSENPGVLKLCRKYNSKVRGCDSAYSYLCAKAGVKEITPTTDRPSGVINFLDDPKIESLPKLMKELEDIVK